MQKNVGFADRAIRIILGLAVLCLPLLGVRNVAVYIALVPLGLVPLLTGVFGICPLYTAALGHNRRGQR